MERFSPLFKNILERLEGVIDRDLNRRHDLNVVW